MSLIDELSSMVGVRAVPRSSEQHVFVDMAAQPFERRHVAGAVPNVFLKARENAASDS